MGSTARENYRAKKGRRPKGPPFVQLHYYLLDSEAWHHLSPVARCAYVELARRYNGMNNGTLAMSVRRLAEDVPCSINTASRALAELVSAGMIENVKNGTFGRKERHASEYRLTCYRCDVTNALPSKKFDPSRRWEKRRRSQYLRQTVAKIETDEPLDIESVSKIATVTPFSGPATVPNIGTHIDIYHGRVANGLPWTTPCVVEMRVTQAA